MTTVALLQPVGAIAPELMALSEYLNATKGYKAELRGAADIVDSSDADLVYRMMGFAPRWRSTPVPEMHDYASLSTGRQPAFKNRIKRLGNRTPILRSFLNTFVQSELAFSDDIPWIHRDMGVPSTFLSEKRVSLGSPEEYEFDLVYVGSLSMARALGEMIRAAAEARLRILLVGEPTPGLRDHFHGQPNVEFSGRVPQYDIPAMCRRAWAGVSHVPNAYPFSQQTATKVLEYCALGMPVVSNRTQWISQFQRDTRSKFLIVDDWSVLNAQLLKSFAFLPPQRGILTWDQVFANCDIAGNIDRALA